MQATEAIKIITGIGEPLSGKMLLLDVQTMQSQVVNTGRTSNVPVTMLAKAVEIPLISIDELKRESGNEGILLVDVRTPEEHNAYNMGGINIPLVEIENSLHLFGNGKRIVMYCASGKRSMQAAKFIKSKMPDVTVASLEGGIKNWRP
jgi:adenylyltransferase/sulfurtransferase